MMYATVGEMLKELVAKLEEPTVNIKAIAPPPEQITTEFDLTGDESYALPFTQSGLTYDYWG